MIFVLQAYIASGQYSKALDDLTKAIEIKPSNKAVFARGVVHLLMEVHAVTLYENAVILERLCFMNLPCLKLAFVFLTILA